MIRINNLKDLENNKKEIISITNLAYYEKIYNWINQLISDEVIVNFTDIGEKTCIITEESDWKELLNEYFNDDYNNFIVEGLDITDCDDIIQYNALHLFNNEEGINIIFNKFNTPEDIFEYLTQDY